MFGYSDILFRVRITVGNQAFGRHQRPIRDNTRPSWFCSAKDPVRFIRTTSGNGLSSLLCNNLSPHNRFDSIRADENVTGFHLAVCELQLYFSVRQPSVGCKALVEVGREAIGEVVNEDFEYVRAVVA